MPPENAALRQAALAVLRKNDVGGWTKPAPRLYPHQWSWDSAFISLGLASHDLDRALSELETLFSAQWRDGRVPHIVFNPDVQDYFPGAEWWASAQTTSMAPREVATSGLIQPPVHALALQRILNKARGARAEGVLARVAALFPRVLAWHRYLATHRDPRNTGLLMIYHPWESGTDNSPRWDAALARIHPGALKPFERHDLKVADASERPTQLEYERYLWLVELLKQARYDDAAVQTDHPFLIRDVLMSAIFSAACAALAEIAAALRRNEADELAGYAKRFGQGVLDAWDDSIGLALDVDEKTRQSIHVQTCAGLAPLLLDDLDGERLRRLVDTLEGRQFAGAPGLAYAVVPSTAPGTPGFQARAYWRGPSWPVFNWLIWWGLGRRGAYAAAARLRSANLALLATPTAEFGEYFEPYTAEPLGSLEQSWTAAVALDWLAADDTAPVARPS